ncbi:MAG: immunity 8 family protein [Ignavibacteriota bacterium]
MTRPIIKSLEITEVPNLDPSAYVPNDPADFSCTLGMTIGPGDSRGGELFYLTVCTPNWLAKACEKDGFMWGRHHLIVPEYNLQAITATVAKFVQGCSGESWQEVASKLNRMAAWEFEEYTPAP